MAWVDPGSEAKFLFQIIGTKLETRVVEFTARERISFPFELKVSLASEEEINFDDVVAKEALLTILGEEANRYIHGIINQFRRTGSKGRFFLYQATVVPSFWLLSLEQDCRIFQNKDVPEIVKQVLQDGGIPQDRFDFRLQSQSPVREYCVQYRETDLNFISRLLEEEGIFYFFEHSENRHVLVFADSSAAYQPIQGEAKVTYNVAEGMVPEEESVYHFIVSRGIHSGKATQRDFNFEKPSLDLTTQEQEKTYQKLEVYDYPGRYLDPGRGKKLSQVRLQELVTFQERAEGRSVCPRFTPGFTFKLTDHDWDKFNREYLLVEVLHTGSQPQVLEEKAAGEGFRYGNDFLGIPSSVSFRPERKTSRPVVEGVQTAIVVGPKGGEIYPDKYGRVKVQFHWDREGKYDEKSSCWIRVAQLWAGPGWGAMYIPRIGQEVVVDFLEGDPDRPMIIGGVYHGNNMPPYPLPDEKTKSTIKSDSSLGGGGFNEIRFEDKKGQEQIFIHAEKDKDIRIKNDLREWIGNETHLIVKKDQLEMTEGDKHLTVKGDHNQKVDGTVSRKVGVDLHEKVGNNYALDAGMEIHLKAGMNLVIESGTTLSLKVGGNFVNINSGGVFIKGTMVMINSGGAAGSGAGSSPAAPKEPQEADTAKPGKKTQLSPAAGSPSPQAQALKNAAQSGTPFCAS
jgi:type VI secretion system secreted protein VgrG